MALQVRNVVIDQGVTYDSVLPFDAPSQGKPSAGWEALLQVRAHPGDPNPPLLEVSSATGHLVVDPPPYEVSLHLDPADTAGLTFTSGVYDLLLMDMAAVPPLELRILAGVVWLRPAVSRVGS